MKITLAPDVIVFEHNHGRQIHPMTVKASDKDAILFDEPETWSCLACGGDNTLEAMRIPNLAHHIAPQRDSRAACNDVKSNPFAEKEMTSFAVDLGDLN